MKNLVVEAQALLLKPEQPIKIGTLTAKTSDGGFIVQSMAGIKEIVYGDFTLGDTVTYQGKTILNKIEQAATKRYYII